MLPLRLCYPAHPSAAWRWRAKLILLAAPKAVDYYAHIGMRQHPSAWVLRPGEVLKG